MHQLGARSPQRPVPFGRSSAAPRPTSVVLHAALVSVRVVTTASANVSLATSASNVRRSVVRQPALQLRLRLPNAASYAALTMASAQAQVCAHAILDSVAKRVRQVVALRSRLSSRHPSRVIPGGSVMRRVAAREGDVRWTVTAPAILATKVHDANRVAAPPSTSYQ